MSAVPTRAINGPIGGVICSIEFFSRTVVAPQRALAIPASSAPARLCCHLPLGVQRATSPHVNDRLPRDRARRCVHPFADGMPVILALLALAESCRFRCYHGSTPPATRFPKFNEPGMSTIATAVAGVVVGIVVSCSFLQDVPGDCDQQAQAKGPNAKNNCRREAHHFTGSSAGAQALWAPHVVFGHRFPFHKHGLSSWTTCRQVHLAIRDTETVGGVQPRSAHSSVPGPRDYL